MTSERPALIFDGDDTLWDTMYLYKRAKASFLRMMEDAGHDPHCVLAYFEDRDKRNVRRLGFSKRRFALSMKQTYRHFSTEMRRASSRTAEGRIRSIATSVFESRPRPIPGVVSTLKKLRSFCKMILVTKGDPKVQRQRIRKAGVATFFDRVHIVPSKNAATFRAFVKKYRLPRQRTWSIGNSVKSDINPALRAGLRAIWIPRKTWAYEEEALLTEKRVVRSSSLREVPRIIGMYGGAQ